MKMNVKVRTLKDGQRKFELLCHIGCPKLSIYAPGPRSKLDDLYEIGGVCATRAEWLAVFARAGLR